MSHPKAAALSVHGRALRDWHEGDRDAVITLHSSLGEHEALPVALFFRGPEEFFPAERYAVELCRGRVLDLGAGTGLHGRVLQERGHRVTALEILPEAAAIARERGIREVVRADMFALPFAPGTFDTVLMLMNGIGPVGTLARLGAFLAELEPVLGTGGQILLDSGEARVVAGARAEAADWPPRTGSTYAGEAWIRLEYRGEMGPAFRELYVDAETLAERVEARGWSCQVAFAEPGGYLARLAPA